MKATNAAKAMKSLNGARAAASLVGIVVLGSCTSQPVILPSRDFDRPTDVTFVCMGTFDPSTVTSTADGGASDAGPVPILGGAKVLSGRPMRECHPRGLVDVASTDRHTFAFLPNSATGELSVVDADTWTLVNLDPANSGFNRLPIGVLPSQIASSDDGCRLVTANAGSCDLSFVDPAALLAPTVSRDEKTNVTTAASTIVTNVSPKAKNSGRELRVRAGEVAFLPMATTELTQAANLCSGDPGHQWQALATFPSCDLVALIDLPSGVIQQAAYTRPTKDGSVALVPLADGEDPVCPVDCGFPAAPDASAGAAAEAGPGDGGIGAAEGGATAGAGASDAAAAPAMAPPPVDPGDVPYVGPGALRPGPIAIVPESGRAYVGLANAAFVLAFDVAPGALAPSGTASAIPLHEGALGVNRVRLSIDPYKDKTTGNLPSGTFIGNDPALDDERRPIVADREYLYVVARDGSLRIVQVAHLPETECETNRDFTLAVNAPLRDVACPPVIGQSVRLPGAIGPGIRLPSPPVDVAVADIRPDPADPSETSVTGAHAWVLSASGAVFLVNIDPVLRHIFFVSDADPSMNPVHACLTPTGDCETETSPPPNTLRNRNFLGFTPALDSSSGPARLDIPPAQSTIGPRIESIWTRGTAANATALTGDFIRTEAFFPDQADVTPQTWTVTWQGNLMASPRLTGQLRSDGSLVDLGLDFCRTGVLRSDIVTFVGCTDTNQCGIGETCVQGSNGAEGAGGLPITGLCLPSTLNHAACDDLLSTVKRYEVTSATTGVLGLIPHKDELVRPALKPCVNLPAGGADGGAGDAGAAPRDASSPDAGADARGAMMNDCVDPEDPSTSTFQCLEGRCLVPCPTPGQTTGCRDGRICVDFSPSCIDGDCFFCADGPPLNKSGSLLPSCLGELIPYQVGVGRGFAVAGSQTGLPATGAAGPDGQCTRMPDLDPRVNARITMDDPMCAAASFPPMPSAITDLSVAQLDSRCDPNLSDPGCPVAAGDPTKAATIASSLLNILEANNLPNPCQYIGGPNETDTPNTLHTHVKALFRNRELHFGMTNLERPPSGIFQIRFDVHGGFQAQQVTIPPTVEVNMPARIVLGPFDAANPVGKTVPAPTAEVPYLFVVDQRRLGNAQGGGPTRGQLLRINPLGLAVTVPVAGNAPWYEDLSHSANEFPIQ